MTHSLDGGRRRSGKAKKKAYSGSKLSAVPLGTLQSDENDRAAGSVHRSPSSGNTDRTVESRRRRRRPTNSLCSRRLSGFGGVEFFSFIHAAVLHSCNLTVRVEERSEDVPVSFLLFRGGCWCGCVLGCGGVVHRRTECISCRRRACCVVCAVASGPFAASTSLAGRRLRVATATAATMMTSCSG